MWFSFRIVCALSLYFTLSILLIPQSFDWLAASHRKLLQPIFSCYLTVSSRGLWRLALRIVVEAFPRPFFRILLLQECLLQTVCPLHKRGLIFKIFESNLSSFALWEASSFFIISVHLFLTFFSSTTFQKHLWPSLHFFLGSMFLMHKEQHSR